jgi:hypothetical protein
MTVTLCICPPFFVLDGPRPNYPRDKTSRPIEDGSTLGSVDEKIRAASPSPDDRMGAYTSLAAILLVDCGYPCLGRCWPCRKGRRGVLGEGPVNARSPQHPCRPIGMYHCSCWRATAHRDSRTKNLMDDEAFLALRERSRTSRSDSPTTLFRSCAGLSFEPGLASNHSRGFLVSQDRLAAM